MREKIKIINSGCLQKALDISDSQLKKIIQGFNELITKSIKFDGKGVISTAIDLVWNDKKIPDKEAIIYLVSLGDMLYSARNKASSMGIPGYT